MMRGEGGALHARHKGRHALNYGLFFGCVFFGGDM